jgi:hypothetical protein
MAAALICLGNVLRPNVRNRLKEAPDRWRARQSLTQSRHLSAAAQMKQAPMSLALGASGTLLSCPLIVDPLPSPVGANGSDAGVELGQELSSLALWYSDCERQFCKHVLRQRHLPRI